MTQPFIHNQNQYDERIELLLLQYKYQSAVRRAARGAAHSYNNIFTGLGGQTTMFQQESRVLGSLAKDRSKFIGDLLQRGISQTEILYNFCRDGEKERSKHSLSFIAEKAVELLNTVSRLHRFVIKNTIERKDISCNLREILLILFYLGENSIEALPDGGDVTLVIHHDKKLPDTITFYFLDQGQGIPPQIVDDFGKPFNSTNTCSPLRGLGLYAAFTLANRQKGQLRLMKIDKMFRAVVSFPATSQNKDDENKDDEKIPSDFLPHGTRPKTINKHCFLVVEDDAALRAMLQKRLQRRGHIVFCVVNCAEAVEEFSNLHDIITLVLMDIGLEDGSGFTCSKKLLSINPTTKIIFMSGSPDSPATIKNPEMILLQKPFSMEQLENAIHDVYI